MTLEHVLKGEHMVDFRDALNHGHTPRESDQLFSGNRNLWPTWSEPSRIEWDGIMASA